MKKIISLLFVAGVLNTVAAQKITMYSTTASERWTSQKVTVLKHASQTRRCLSIRIVFYSMLPALAARLMK